MNRFLTFLFCTVFLLASGISNVANAQGSKAAAQPHLAAAKAAAYEQGNDLTVLYDTVCAPALSDRVPVERDQQDKPGQAPRKECSLARLARISS